MRSLRNRFVMIPLAAVAILVPLLAMRCTSRSETRHAPNCDNLVVDYPIGVSFGPESLTNVSATLTPPTWLAFKDVASPASLIMQGQTASGQAISQTLTVPFSLPSSRVMAPLGGLALDLTPPLDQQSAYDSFIAAADPSRGESATASVSYQDVRILTISNAVYQPYEVTVTFYLNGAETGQVVDTQSLSGGWSSYLQSAISQVPANAWTMRVIGKPPNQIEDYTYYKNVLIGDVGRSMMNFSNQNPTLANSNLLDAMSHLDGNPNRTQYIADPAARDNLYGIFQKVQLHVTHVATGVAETL